VWEVVGEYERRQSESDIVCWRRIYVFLPFTFDRNLLFSSFFEAFNLVIADLAVCLPPPTFKYWKDVCLNGDIDINFVYCVAESA
jgi:hypothetical protein